MGRLHLNKYLERYDCKEYTTIQDLIHEGVTRYVVDYFLWIGTFIKATSHDKQMIISLVTCYIDRFHELGAELFFVVDGKAHPLKYKTQKKRVKIRRDNQDRKCNRIIQEMKLVSDIVIVPNVQIQEEDIEDVQEAVLTEEEKANREEIKRLAAQYNKAIIDGLPPVLTKEDMNEIRDIIMSKDCIFIQASGEGEKCCADLVYHKAMDASITRDSDSIACLCPLTILEVQPNMTCTILRSDTVLKKLDMTPEQWIDFCVLISNDYLHTTIPGVGPVKAYNLIQEYKSIENIITYRTDLDYSFILEDYDTVRDLTMPVEDVNSCYSAYR